MSLADKIAEVRARPKRCKVGEWMASLDQESQTAIAGYLADPELSLALLFQMARSEGMAMQITAFKAHCTGVCICVDTA